MAAHKKAQQLAKQLFQLSLENGVLSSDRVSAVLAHVERTKPAHMLEVLKAYERQVAREVARCRAEVEYAGNISTASLDRISASLSSRYGRTITWVSKPNPALIAGLKVRVGDDVYESSIAAQLATLATS